MCWYKKGLYFKCLKCSKCCGGFPGYVWINDKEIEKIANFLNLSKSNFLKKYTRQINGFISLKENLINYDCCFLKDKKCIIYEVRPTQCKEFPFWKNNLKSFFSWQSLKDYCPGIDNKKGKFFSFEEIQKKLIHN
jgi:Fe-S-cluster containining protein